MHLESSVGNSPLDIQHSQLGKKQKRELDERLRMKTNVQLEVMVRLGFYKKPEEGQPMDQAELDKAWERWMRLEFHDRFREAYDDLMSKGVSDQSVLVSEIFQKLNKLESIM